VDFTEGNIDTDGKRLLEGLVFLLLYCLTIPLAVYLTGNVGWECVPDGPCKIYVAPGLMATTGSPAIGATFVLRDFIQRRFGLGVSACAVVMGAAIAGLTVPPSLVVASAAGVFVAGCVDMAIYTFIARKRFVAAVVTSSLISAAVDSTVFLWIAYESLALVPGQTLGKAWIILAAVPFTHWLWRRDERIGLAAA
jgi:uncharacterized PurR-regulated membrane protein YhhQ (DUF165 family)